MDYYRNENPGDGSSGIGGGGSSSSGGSWKNRGSDAPEWNGSQQETVIPGWFYSRILRKNGPWLMLDGAELLAGTTPCKEVPLLVTIRGENHSDCLRLEIPGRSLTKLRDFIYVPVKLPPPKAFIANTPLPASAHFLMAAAISSGVPWSAPLRMPSPA